MLRSAVSCLAPRTRSAGIQLPPHRIRAARATVADRRSLVDTFEHESGCELKRGVGFASCQVRSESPRTLPAASGLKDVLERMRVVLELI